MLSPRIAARLLTPLGLLLLLGCQDAMVRHTDNDVATVLRARQRAALGSEAPAAVGLPDEPVRPAPSARARVPHPTHSDVPPAFEGASDSAPDTLPTSQPVPRRATIFTLTDALAYAQQHRRAYQSAKEELYVAALNLLLERHLWTPIFASELKTVYGNYGEAQNFDQAMRFVADLSVSQRLPYGGEFTAAMVSTLIRDVGQTITAAEGSTLNLGLNIPFLRGAGHVAQEDRIRLERELTYSVRTFERFRRQQLVIVASSYFDLLAAKQSTIDSQDSLDRADYDFERAKAQWGLGMASALDVLRAEQGQLSAENDRQRALENFRSQADQFKLQIGMPVDEPLGVDDLEDIQTIEQRGTVGEYSLLARPPAAEREQEAIAVALERRLDLLTVKDRVDDARRGFEISQNALLPDLNWSGSLAFDTDSNHYNAGAFHFERANWKTELTLELPLERTRERNALRQSLIEVRSAQRTLEEESERVRVEVRRIVNNIRLQDRLVEIQQRAVAVNESQRDYAQWQFEEGEIDNRDKLEAERRLLDAQNALNQAKTARWGLLLQFRLATETLRVGEDGAQHPDPD